MKNNEVFEEIFSRYKPATQKLNDISPSLYPKDEYKLRHGVFKAIFNEYRSYKFKVFLTNIKERFKAFKARLKDKKKERVIKEYKKYCSDAPPQEVPPNDAPPQEVPPNDAPPQEVPPNDAPPVYTWQKKRKSTTKKK